MIEASLYRYYGRIWFKGCQYVKLLTASNTDAALRSYSQLWAYSYLSAVFVADQLYYHLWPFNILASEFWLLSSSPPIPAYFLPAMSLQLLVRRFCGGSAILFSYELTATCQPSFLSAVFVVEWRITLQLSLPREIYSSNSEAYFTGELTPDPRPPIPAIFPWQTKRIPVGFPLTIHPLLKRVMFWNIIKGCPKRSSPD